MKKFEEDRAHEQYFFTEETAAWICRAIVPLQNVACVCCPMLSTRPEIVGREDVKFLDIDLRFPNVEYFDLRRPKYPAKFHALVLDPPFWGVSLKQILNATLYLLDWDPTRELLVTYLTRRRTTFLRIFHAFNLREVAEAHYATAKPGEKNRTLIFANFELL